MELSLWTGFFFFLHMCVGEGLDGYGYSESVDMVGMCEWFVMEELAGHAGHNFASSPSQKSLWSTACLQ